MIINILGWCLFGLVAGGLARLLVPGRDPLGCLGTIGLGVAGSFVGGLLSHLLFGRADSGIEPAGLVGAVVGGILVLLAWRRFATPI